MSPRCLVVRFITKCSKKIHVFIYLGNKTLIQDIIFLKTRPFLNYNFMLLRSIWWKSCYLFFWVTPLAPKFAPLSLIMQKWKWFWVGIRFRSTLSDTLTKVTVRTGDLEATLCVTNANPIRTRVPVLTLPSGSTTRLVGSETTNQLWCS